MSTKKTRRNRIPRSDRGKTRRDRTRRPHRRQFDFLENARGGSAVGATVPSRRRLAPGTVVWARIDFVDGNTSKIRPCVVLDHPTKFDTCVAPLTTKVSGPRRIDQVDLHLPAECGFCGTLRTIARTDVISIAGTLTEVDFDRAQAIQRTVTARRSRNHSTYDIAA